MTVLCSALPAFLKAATAAGVIAVTGPCPAVVGIYTAPSGTVLDFSAAPATRLDLTGLSGVMVKGYVSTNAPLMGLYVLGSNHIVVDGARCIAPGSTCVSISGSDQVEVKAPWVTGSKGDGIDIAGSTNVQVHDGACEANVPTVIHPDCVQLWSLPGHPVLYVKVSGMVAIGDTMGFDDWDATDLGGSDVQFLDNTVASTWANCVGTLYVHKLIITGNRCVSLPGGTTGPTVIRKPVLADAVVSGNVNGVKP